MIAVFSRYFSFDFAVIFFLIPNKYSCLYLILYHNVVIFSWKTTTEIIYGSGSTKLKSTL